MDALKDLKLKYFLTSITHSERKRKREREREREREKKKKIFWIAEV